MLERHKTTIISLSIIIQLEHNAHDKFNAFLKMQHMVGMFEAVTRATDSAVVLS